MASTLLPGALALRLPAGRFATLSAAAATCLEAQAGRWALWLAPCMAAGAVAELTARQEPPPWLGGAMVGGFAALTLALRGYRWRRMPAWAGLAIGLGVLSTQCATWRAPKLLDVPRRAVIITGTVEAVEHLPTGRRVTIAHPALRGPGAASDAPPADRTVRIRLRDAPDAPDVQSGDVIRVRAMLSAPSPPSVPGGWDLRRDAFFGGIGAYGFALNPAERLGHVEAGTLSRVLAAAREAIVRRVDAVLPPDQAAIAATLLTGSPSAMAPADKAAFRDSGLAHLLAIAGLHIGIVMGLVFGTVRLLLAAWPWIALRAPTKAIAAFSSVAVGGFYMLLTGAHVPIMRSFAMACLVLLAVLTGRRALSLRGLALAMAAILLIAPNEVLGVSFQMSFSAVLALIAGYDVLRPWLRQLHGSGAWPRRILSHVVALALTSALAGTASTPYGAYHFGHIQLYYVLANMIAVPLTALWVMPLGLLALALMPLGLEAAALIPMGWGETAILLVGRNVAAIPHAVVPVAAPSAAGLIALSLGLAWLGMWRGRIRLLGMVGLLAGLASASLTRPADVLISADARLIGVRLPAGVFVQARPGASSFTRDAWQSYWVADEMLPLPQDGDAVGGSIACDETGCLIHTEAGDIRVARRPPEPADCDAALIVSAEPVRLRCPASTVIVDRFSVWREGAHAIWLDGAHRVLIRTAHAVTGDRPWAPPPQRARAAPGLPLATPE